MFKVNRTLSKRSCKKQHFLHIKKTLVVLADTINRPFFKVQYLVSDCRKVYLELGEGPICLEGPNIDKSKLKMWSKYGQ